MKLKFVLPALLLTAFCFAAHAQSGRKIVQPIEPTNQTVEKNEDEKPETKKEEPRGEVTPVKIYRTPAPDASVARYCFRKEGFDFVKTILRVTFDATAKITGVEVKTASGCNAFDEEAVDAARGIKFEPAVQDGKPITVYKNIAYQGGIR